MSCGTLTPVATDAKCCVAAGTAADVLIDDLEDGDNVLKAIGNRQGYWYTYGTDKAQMPAPGTTFVPTAGGKSPLFASLTSGSVAPATETVPTNAGMGFDFNNHFKKSCAYNASVYKGITFWAKGTVPFKVAVGIPGTTPKTADGGTCVPGATMGCYDHYNTLVAPPPDGTTWAQFTVTFADKTTFAQAGWGAVAAFDAAALLNVQFQVDGTATATAATPYNFAVDDVAFVP